MMNNTIYDFIIFSLTGAFFITILGISRLFIKKMDKKVLLFGSILLFIIWEILAVKIFYIV